jgi:hypothetical protein
MKRLFTCLLALPTLLLIVAACDNGISAEGFDQSCTLDKDCVAVFLGDLCANPNCNCPNDAINKSSLNSYNSEAATKLAACPAGSGGPACSCVFHTVSCVQGTCMVK